MFVTCMSSTFLCHCDSAMTFCSLIMRFLYFAIPQPVMYVLKLYRAPNASKALSEHQQIKDEIELIIDYLVNHKSELIFNLT